MKENQETPFRPPIDALKVSDYIAKCMKACWQEEPELRPDIRYVMVRLKPMQVTNLTNSVFYIMKYVFPCNRPV